MSSTQSDAIDGISTSTAVKSPVRVATTANVTLAGLQTIDGQTLAEGDRVLVKNQTSAAANGIYDCVSTSWARSPDFDGTRDVVDGTQVYVRQGSTNGASYWQAVCADFPVNIGTSLVTFNQALFGSSSTLTFIQAGTGAVARSAQNKMRDFFNLADFGAVGDNTTDDRAAIQAALDAVNALGGGVIFAEPGKIYRIVQSTASAAALIINDDTTLDLQGSKLRLILTGTVYGVRLLNRSQISNGEIEVVSAGVTDANQGIWQCNVSIGPATGEGGTVASPSAHDSAKGWRIADLKLTTNRDGGYVIGGIGGINNGVIERIDIASSSTVRVCIGFDWGYLGTLSSAEASMATNKTNYNASTAYTTHPHNIVVRDINIGNMSRSSGAGDNFGCHALRLSACHHIIFENIKIAGVTHSGFHHVGGDLGFEYASAADRIQAYRGICVRNVTLIDGSSAKQGAWVDTLADNVYRAQYSEAYTVLVSPKGQGDILIENCTFNGPNADSTYGVRLQGAKGVTVRGCSCVQWQEGVWVDEMSQHCTIEGNIIRDNRRNGVLVGLSELREATNHITVRDNLIIANATQGTYAGIELTRGHGHIVEGNLLGDFSDANQDYGIFVRDDNVRDIHIRNNHVRGAVSVAYSLMSGTPGGPHIYRGIGSFFNNTADFSVPTFGSGEEFVPSNTKIITNRHRTDFYTNQTGDPAAGSWYNGEQIWRTDFAASTAPGRGCITSGTFGTLAGLTNAATTNTSKVITMSLQSKTADTTESSYVIVVNSATNLRKGLKVTIAASGISNAEIIAISGTSITLDAQANATLLAQTLTTAGVIVGEVISLDTTPARTSCIVNAIDGASVTLDTAIGSTETGRTATYTVPVFKAMAVLAA